MRKRLRHLPKSSLSTSIVVGLTGRRVPPTLTPSPAGGLLFPALLVLIGVGAGAAVLVGQAAILRKQGHENRVVILRVQGGQESTGRRKTSKYFTSDKQKSKNEKEVEEFSAKRKSETADLKPPPGKKVHKNKNDDEDFVLTTTKVSTDVTPSKKLKADSGIGTTKKYEELDENDEDGIKDAKSNSKVSGRGSGGRIGKTAPGGQKRMVANESQLEDVTEEIPEGAPDCLAGLTFVVSGTLDRLFGCKHFYILRICHRNFGTWHVKDAVLLHHLHLIKNLFATLVGEKQEAAPRSCFDVCLIDKAGMITASMFGELAEKTLQLSAIDTMKLSFEELQTHLDGVCKKFDEQQYLIQLQPFTNGKNDDSKLRYNILTTMKLLEQKSVLDANSGEQSKKVRNS